MGLFDDDTPKKPKARHQLGEDLSPLSVAELEERIGELTSEIERLEREIASKGATRSAAESFFRKS